MTRQLTVPCIALVLLTCGAIAAQTPDGLPPANEGVCDDLKSYTPGLYGLCIAFCEAQDCVPDPEAEDPFENCSPSSDKLFRNYQTLMQPGDPEMPCYQSPCPCWSEEELEAFRYPGVGDEASCIANSTIPGIYTSRDSWDVFGFDPFPRVDYRTGLFTVSWNVTSGGPRCVLIDVCRDGDCFQVIRDFGLSAEQYEDCRQGLVQSRIDRGIEDCIE